MLLLPAGGARRESQMPARAPGTQRAASNGLWYTPALGPPPSREGSFAESRAKDIAELKRQQALERAMEQRARDEERRRSDTQAWADSVREGLSPTGPETHADGRLSPTNPLANYQPPVRPKVFRRARWPKAGSKSTRIGTGRGDISKSARIGAMRGDGPPLNLEGNAPAGAPTGATARSPKAKPSARSPSARAATPKGGKASGGGSRAGVPDESTALQPSAEIRAEAMALISQAEEHEASADAFNARDDFDRRLAKALVAATLNKPLADLMREWDRNNDGQIAPIELRACVRNSLGVKAENREIDEWFAVMDADGSGEVHMNMNMCMHRHSHGHGVLCNS